MADQKTEAPPEAVSADAPVDSAEAIASEALRSAERALTDLSHENTLGENAAAFQMPSFDKKAGGGRTPSGMDLLADVNLNVKIELGRTRMLVEDVLRLGEGSVVELDKLAGDPVDIYVNDRPVARGEVLVLNDNFCVRISEIISHTGNSGA